MQEHVVIINTLGASQTRNFLHNDWRVYSYIELKDFSNKGESKQRRLMKIHVQHEMSSEIKDCLGDLVRIWTIKFLGSTLVVGFQKVGEGNPIMRQSMKSLGMWSFIGLLLFFILPLMYFAPDAINNFSGYGRNTGFGAGSFWFFVIFALFPIICLVKISRVRRIHDAEIVF